MSDVLSPEQVAEIQARHEQDARDKIPLNAGALCHADRAALLASHEALRADRDNFKGGNERYKKILISRIDDMAAELEAARAEIARLRGEKVDIHSSGEWK